MVANPLVVANTSAAIQLPPAVVLSTAATLPTAPQPAAAAMNLSAGGVTVTLAGTAPPTIAMPAAPIAASAATIKVEDSKPPPAVQEMLAAAEAQAAAERKPRVEVKPVFDDNGPEAKKMRLEDDAPSSA